ncbi:CS1 type fimbrial major subunit [Streptomyces sp. NPDC001941]|uniref:CS1 type fimbrial major subunit n=1 Tax=Streptomyces sp. NPDC001941 TaxID=3154659 RepID=UPI00333294D5
MSEPRDQHSVRAQVKFRVAAEQALQLLGADRSALPEVLDFDVRAADGILPYRQQVRFFSEDNKTSVRVRLDGDAELKRVDGGEDDKGVPLRIELNGRVLNAAGVEFAAADLFDGALPDASLSLPLKVMQARPRALAPGRYEGEVTLVVKYSP